MENQNTENLPWHRPEILKLDVNLATGPATGSCASFDFADEG